MKKPGCQVCMCNEVDPCRIQPLEVVLLFVLMRPVRCPHCTTRQYAWIAPIRKLLQMAFAPGQAAMPYRREEPQLAPAPKSAALHGRNRRSLRRESVDAR